MSNPARIDAQRDAPGRPAAFERLNLLTGSSAAERQAARELFIPRIVRPGVTIIRQGSEPAAL